MDQPKLVSVASTAATCKQLNNTALAAKVTPWSLRANTKLSWEICRGNSVVARGLHGLACEFKRKGGGGGSWRKFCQSWASKETTSQGDEVETLSSSSEFVSSAPEVSASVEASSYSLARGLFKGEAHLFAVVEQQPLANRKEGGNEETRGGGWVSATSMKVFLIQVATLLMCMAEGTLLSAVKEDISK